MKRLVLILAALLLVVAFSFGQQPQLTAISTIGGDAVTTIQCRSAEYLPSGVIWLQAADVPYTGKNFVYLSTDNGATWVKRSVYTNAALGSAGISMITAKDANTALVCLTTGEILRTTNAGVKWDTVTSYSTPDVAFCDGIKFVGQDTVIAYGDADDKGIYVARSIDAGKTWTRYPNVNSSLPGDSLNIGGIYAGYVTYGSAMEVYGKTIWITLYNTANDPPSILKSTDGGTTWSWFRVTLPGGPALNYYIRSITFKDNNVGFAVTKRAYVNATSNDNYLVKTTDGGRTWSDTINVAPGKGHVDAKPDVARAIRGTNTVIAVGWGGASATSTSMAWISNDNGSTWTSMNAPSPVAGSDLRNCAFGSTTQGLLFGYNNVVKFSLVTAVENEHGVIPTGFALEQNYPNPFNPTTKITYSVPKTSVVELKVYDLLGRTVATLVNGEQAVGTYTVNFNAQGLSSGVYVYTMKAGDFKATKSLVLVK
jgi:photosystem II stability/assembly factor-like uncharacterized protein